MSVKLRSISKVIWVLAVGVSRSCALTRSGRLRSFSTWVPVLAALMSTRPAAIPSTSVPPAPIWARWLL
ncbi:hypothetical protein [Raoultella sp. BIGb0149]|uniref:hypothetical protein n=1 Tax=Raoultella sp. BIGb0149 TaxID=2485116 RepID=UPI001414D884|nr:hypothetical protein [Raoultella sp. BIGb0149]